MNNPHFSRDKLLQLEQLCGDLNLSEDSAHFAAVVQLARDMATARFGGVSLRGLGPRKWDRGS